MGDCTVLECSSVKSMLVLSSQFPPPFLGSVYQLPLGVGSTEPGCFSDLSVYSSFSWVTLCVACNGSGFLSPSIDGGVVCGHSCLKCFRNDAQKSRPSTELAGHPGLQQQGRQLGARTKSYSDAASSPTSTCLAWPMTLSKDFQCCQSTGRTSHDLDRA